jgi:hypothetical protein
MVDKLPWQPGYPSPAASDSVKNGALVIMRPTLHSFRTFAGETGSRPPDFVLTIVERPREVAGE